MRVKKITPIYQLALVLITQIVLYTNYAAAQNYSKYVNPFVGTEATGHTFPGATVPFGMVQLSPQTGNFDWAYCSGYRYEDKSISGFSHTQLNGTGAADLGDILVFPYQHIENNIYKSTFAKNTEKASPGFYQVTLADNDIKAELTTAAHTGLHRYTFSKAGEAHLLVDLQYGVVDKLKDMDKRVIESSVKIESKTVISGYIRSSRWVDKKIFFVLKTAKPFLSADFLDGVRKRQIILNFNAKKSEAIEMRVALSTVSVDGARKNMTETAGQDFDAVKTAAEKTWNTYLSKITIEGSTAQKENFYTSMYHLGIQPNNIADLDGKYRAQDDKIYQSASKKYYSTLSLWDTYRAAHPMYTILFPDQAGDMVQSMLGHFNAAGTLPVWTLFGKETFTMIGNHSVPVIADAMLKGLKGFDYEKAYQAVKTTLTTNGNPKYNWDIYNKYGYLPSGLVKVESVSRTLEAAYDDWCAAQIAKLLSKTADYNYFTKRAGFYANLFDKSTGLMRGKKADGTWVSPFNPLTISHAESKGGDYSEANAWQYTWSVQHDVEGLIKLMGGPDKFAARLDSLFTMDSKVTGEGSTLDVTGLIGQYAHGNEPSHHIAYLYTYAGQPWKTQELIPKILKEQYKSTPDGLSGNDDCGQMSAWYMFSALGFYPVNPAEGKYIFGTPAFPKAVIHLGDKDLVIEAPGVSEKNIYVQKIELNGKTIAGNFITHKELMAGGKLLFTMGPKPAAITGAAIKKKVNDKLGTCTHFSQGWDEIRIMPLIRSSGMGWIRDDLNWQDIETKKGKYVIPEKTMRWIKAAHANDLKLILILNKGNKLYKNPYDPDAYARFAAAMAKQLKPDVDALELLNEPANFGFMKHYGGHWNGIDSTGKQEAWVNNYVTLLNKAASAIKAVNPTVKVLGLGSVAPVNFRQLEAGVSADVDGLTDHPYSYRTVPEIIPYSAAASIIKRDGLATADEKGTFSSQIAMYRAQSARFNGPKEIWLTEFGYSVFQPAKKALFAGFTAAAQAKYLQRRLMQGLGLGVDRLVQYDFKDDGLDPHEAEHHFGLIDTELQPKASFYAVQRLATATAGFKVANSLKVGVFPVADRPDEYPISWDGAKLAAPGTIPVYEFKDDAGKAVLAMWSAERADGDFTDRIADLRIDDADKVIREISQLDLMTGETTQLPFLRKDGKVVIEKMTVKDYPVLLYLL